MGKYYVVPLGFYPICNNQFLINKNMEKSDVG